MGLKRLFGAELPEEWMSGQKKPLILEKIRLTSNQNEARLLETTRRGGVIGDEIGQLL